VVVAVGETLNATPLALDPIELPPEATVYHAIVLPADVADKSVDVPLQITAGEAVAGLGAAGMPTGIVIIALSAL